MAYELSFAIGGREVLGFHGILVNARIFIFTELGGYADRFTAASIAVIRRGGGALGGVSGWISGVYWGVPWECPLPRSPVINYEFPNSA
jgi:hypothetical protein